MARTPQLLGPDGTPVQRKLLNREIAAPSVAGPRNLWSHQSVVSGLTPDRMSDVLKKAAAGDTRAYLTLAEEMEELEPHYRSVLSTRKLAVASVEIQIDAASDSPRDIEIAEAVRGIIETPAFEAAVDDLLDGIAKGYSVVEILWETGNRFEPRGFEWRDPRFFHFDKVTGRDLRMRDEGDPNGIELPPYKFMVHRPRLKSGLSSRAGLARLAAWSFMFKSYTVKDWIAFVEVYGLPLRLGRYGPSATEENLKDLVAAVMNIGTDGAGILPDSMRVEFQELSSNASGDIFEKAANFFDKQVSKAVLGQTMTTDDGSSRSQAQVHDDVRLEIKRSDCRQLATTIRRDLVVPYINLNFGLQEAYPAISMHVPEPEDLKELRAAIKEMVPLGLPVPERFVREKYGIPDAEEGDVLLGRAAPADTGTDKNRRQSCPVHGSAAHTVQDDELDEIDREALEEWEEQIGPMIAPIERLLESAGSYEEFLAGLDGAAGDMDNSELVRRLAEAAFKARGLGDAAAD